MNFNKLFKNTDMNTIIDALKWRYATKIFDTNKKLSPAQEETLKDAVNLTATSLGLQPFRVIIIKDQATKEKLKPFSYNQAQIDTASHLFLFCTVNNVDENFANDYIDRMATIRKMDEASLAGSRQMIQGFIQNYNQEQKLAWSANQAYIALGQLLTVAAVEEIDACPMEGFSAPDYNKILNLEEKGLSAKVLAAVGFRSEEDKYAHLPKVRLDHDDLFIEGIAE